jgi:hypothetical protein
MAAFLVWRIGRDAFGPSVALAAVACFTLFPTVLAHFGLATTDGPFLAAFAAATYALMYWARGPTVLNGIGLGVASGLGSLFGRRIGVLHLFADLFDHGALDGAGGLGLEGRGFIVLLGKGGGRKGHQRGGEKDFHGGGAKHGFFLSL